MTNVLLLSLGIVLWSLLGVGVALIFHVSRLADRVTDLENVATPPAPGTAGDPITTAGLYADAT